MAGQKYLSTKPLNRQRKNYRKKKYIRKPYKARRMKGPFSRYDKRDPVGPSYLCKITYSELVGFTTGIGGVIAGQKTYRLNSLFDPNETDAGHQPYYFDQMALLYQRYKVSGCLVEMTWTNPTADGMAAIMMVQPSDSALSLNGLSQQLLAERPQVVVRQMNNTGKQVERVKQYFDISKVEGLSKLQFKADTANYSATTTSNPAYSPTISLGSTSNNGDSGVSIQCNIKLTYFVRFYERIQPSQS